MIGWKIKHKLPNRFFIIRAAFFRLFLFFGQELAWITRSFVCLIFAGWSCFGWRPLPSRSSGLGSSPFGNRCGDVVETGRLALIGRIAGRRNRLGHLGRFRRNCHTANPGLISSSFLHDIYDIGAVWIGRWRLHDAAGLAFAPLPVSVQSVGADELLLAVAARVGPLFGVHQLVGLKVGVLGEPFLANVALVRLLPRVEFQMRLQVS